MSSCTICTSVGGCAIANDTSIWNFVYVNDAPCDGTPIPENACLEAARLAVGAAGNTFPDLGMLQITNGRFASSGCSVQAGPQGFYDTGDWAAHWNDATGAPYTFTDPRTTAGYVYGSWYPPVCQSDTCLAGKTCGQAAVSITNGVTTPPAPPPGGGNRRQQARF